MTPLEEDILTSLNKIRDNLWIQDYDEVVKIASGIMNRPEALQIMEYGEKGHDLIKEIRRESRFRENKREWLVDNVEKYFVKNDFLVDKYIFGTILLRLKPLSYKEKKETKESSNLTIRGNYKFRIIDLYPKYEIRAILVNKSKSLNKDDLDDLSNKLESSTEIEKTLSSTVLRLFSRNAFIESTVLPYTAWLKIVLKSGDRTNVEKIADVILSKFSGGEMENKISATL